MTSLEVNRFGNLPGNLFLKVTDNSLQMNFQNARFMNRCYSSVVNTASKLVDMATD